MFVLYCWRYTWETLNPGAAYETKPTSTTEKPPWIEKGLHFHSHERAAEIQLYNATQLFLLGLIERLSPNEGQMTTIPQQTALLAATASNYPIAIFSSNPDQPLQLPNEITTIRDPAIEIARIFEFQMDVPSRNRESNLFFLFPLGIAWEVMKEEEQYKGWMKEILDKSPITSGYAIGRNRWFGKYYLPKVRFKRADGETIIREAESGRFGGYGGVLWALRNE